MTEFLALLNRIDERTLALREGLERLMAELEVLRDAVRVVERNVMRVMDGHDGLTENDYAALRRIIREEFERASLLTDEEIRALALAVFRREMDRRGVTLREVILFAIAIAGFTLGLLDRVQL